MERIDPDTIYEVARKLIGRIDGYSDVYVNSSANLDTQLKLIDLLLKDVAFVARSRICHEASVKAAGDKAYKYLRDLNDNYDLDDYKE